MVVASKKTANKPLLAFHGDATLKRRLVAEIRKHEKQDQIIQGTYGRQNGVWKGCAVGCSIHSLCNISKRSLATNDHSLYETEFGIPIGIAYLEDSIFEGLTVDEAKAFPFRLIKAVSVGADLSPVLPKFFAWMLDDLEHGVIRFADDAVKISIHAIADLHRQSLVKNVSADKWSAAESAAWSAARSAQANKLIEIIAAIK